VFGHPLHNFTLHPITLHLSITSKVSPKHIKSDHTPFNTVLLSGMSRVEYCGFSNVSTNTDAAIIRTNMCWGFWEALYRADIRWRLRCEGCDWWKRGTDYCPISSEHVAGETGDEKTGPKNSNCIELGDLKE
jgi:hypothetical protein